MPECNLPLKIAGMGRYLPRRVVTNREIEEMLALAPGSLDEQSLGIRERRWVSGGETNSWMAARAAEEALVNAGMHLSDIDLLIDASATQEQSVPSDAPFIQKELGSEASGLASFTVHATCLSFFVGLHLAATLLVARQYENILLISSEIASVGLNPKDISTLPIFGDCAAAAVLTRTPEGESSKMSSYVLRTYPEGAEYTSVRGGGTRRHPNSSHTLPDDNYFQMNGARTIRFGLKYIAQMMEAVRPGLSKEFKGMQLLVPHQASRAGIDIFKRVHVPRERIMVTFNKLGNCVAASMPATLYEAVREGRIRRGDNVLLGGGAAGLTLGLGIITY